MLFVLVFTCDLYKISHSMNTWVPNFLFFLFWILFIRMKRVGRISDTNDHTQRLFKNSCTFHVTSLQITFAPLFIFFAILSDHSGTHLDPCQLFQFSMWHRANNAKGTTSCFYLEKCTYRLASLELNKMLVIEMWGH